MMDETHFDTMVAVRRLRDTGFDASQAEAITATVRDGVTGGVATKSDLLRVETALRADMSGLETALRADMSGLETALRADMSGLETEFKSELSRVETKLETELKWIKTIGGGILAALVLPWLAEAIPLALPG